MRAHSADGARGWGLCPAAPFSYVTRDVLADGPRPLLFACSLLLACAPAEPAAERAAAAPPSPTCAPIPVRPELDAFVGTNRSRYIAAIGRARTFLDSLDVDPATLRAHQIKGKKKLVEALDAYSLLYRIAAPADRPALLARVDVLARPTAADAYHDMLAIDDRAFHEDATSYLRAALLLDRLGRDIHRYRSEIAAMKWRLDQHMRTRGPHQRRAFHGYYRHFGLAEPFPLEGALEQGLIAGRAVPEKLSRLDVYALTHEVYAAYDFGDSLEATPFAPAERAYLRDALPRLVAIWLERRDIDLVAELSTCSSYLRFTSDPLYAGALGKLLDEQNADGSWGDYALARARLGDMVKQGLYLHTTMVTVEALAFGFDDTLRRRETSGCR